MVRGSPEELLLVDSSSFKNDVSSNRSGLASSRGSTLASANMDVTLAYCSSIGQLYFL